MSEWCELKEKIPTSKYRILQTIFSSRFFFSNVYISLNTIFECSYLFFGWEIGHPLNTYATGEMEGCHPKCVKVCTGGEGCHVSRVRTHLHYLFSCFCLIVSCFICKNLTLASFKKGMFVRNDYFSPWSQVLLS